MLRSSEKSRPPTIKRTLEVSGFDARLRVRSGVVILEREGKEVAKVAAIDIGVLVVDTPNAQFTTASLVEIVEHGGLVILCGADHVPSLYVLPVWGNTLQGERKQQQLALPKRARNRVWQRLVQAKIRNQAQVAPVEEVREALLQLAERVKPGDPDNMEARAARIYWSKWLDGQPFERDRYGPPPNLFLNYGYIILRGVLARAVCAAGLDPAFGVHHVGGRSGFPLADDLMEPFRGWVDRAALELHRMGAQELNKETKARLLQVLYEPAWFDSYHSTVAVAAERLVGSFVRVLTGDEKDITVPRMPTAEEVWNHAEKGSASQGEDGTSTSLE